MSKEPTLFLETLGVAVALELAKVTDASMDLFLADRDRYLRCLDRATALAGQVAAIYAAADKSEHGEQKLTDEQRAEVDQLNVEITELYDHADKKTMLGLIAGKSDELLYGGKHCAKTFSALAVSLAHMAHADGGITFAGLHWCRSGHNGTGHTCPCGAELARCGQAVA